MPAPPLDSARSGPHVALRTHDIDRVVKELARRDVIGIRRDSNKRSAFRYKAPEDVTVLRKTCSLCVRG